MPSAIAFAGKIGSGKTTVSAALAEALKWKRASFGDYVRHVVSSRGQPLTRKNLQETGSKILQEDSASFCRNVLLHSGWCPGESVIIDGLRHAETITEINRLIYPARLRLIYLDVDEETRVARLGSRGISDTSEVEAADAHSTEQQVTTFVRGTADLVLDARKPVEECVAALLEWIAKYETVR